MMNICFDLDGTIANLYGVENWLDYLNDYNPVPYQVAKPLMNLSTLARKLNRLQAQGHKITVISWLSKYSTADYDKAVTMAKLAWLRKHLASVHFDAIHIVPYGVNKWTVCGGADSILFDDETPNRNAWENGKAYEPCQIMEILRSL